MVEEIEGLMRRGKRGRRKIPEKAFELLSMKNMLKNLPQEYFLYTPEVNPAEDIINEIYIICRWSGEIRLQERMSLCLP